jgi:hypothetical protein
MDGTRADGKEQPLTAADGEVAVTTAFYEIFIKK